MKDAIYAHSLKDKIIYNVLIYQKTNDEKTRTEAIELLKQFAKHYNLQCIKSKKYKIPLESALLKFIENKSGYMETINQLFSSI